MVRYRFRKYRATLDAIAGREAAEVLARIQELSVTFD
jgi:hypothetical protein